jgi:pseudouridine synthase
MEPKKETMRLNKYLALQLGISRREADEFIEKKKIKVDDKTARLGQQVLPSQIITLDDKPIETRNSKQYIILNKPIGYVCSRRQQGDVPTIYKLLPSNLHHLKPVGRLDKDSSGLILITNDGDFAHKMTHPKFYKQKVYEVELNAELKLEDLKKIEKGVQLEDGISKFSVQKITGDKYKITMSEGRNRQIRRTFAALGYKVTKLHRIEFGNFSLVNLNIEPKQWCKINI